MIDRCAICGRPLTDADLILVYQEPDGRICANGFCPRCRIPENYVPPPQRVWRNRAHFDREVIYVG